MNKFYNLLFLILFLKTNLVFTQAVNFITYDCDGIQYNLHDSLEAGNVIVISWVMPCGPCATYSLPAFNASQTFSSAFPGRVHFYMVDDYANTSCPSLINWAVANSFPSSLISFFSSADISMDNYGTHGMPKVVVLGGLDHQIFFNENDVNITKSGVESAIFNALSSTTDIEEIEVNNEFTLFPVPSLDELIFIHFYSADKIKNMQINIFDSFGNNVEGFDEKFIKKIHQNKFALNVSDLKNGIYFLNISTPFFSKTSKFIINRI